MHKASENINVIVIEDDPNDAILINEFLNGCTNPKFKTAWYDRIGTIKKNTPDIILTDLNLPDSTGINTFYSVKKLFPDSPIIVLSGQDDEEVARLAVREGAQDFIPKKLQYIQTLERHIIYAIERGRNVTLVRELHQKTLNFAAKTGKELDDVFSSVFSTINEIKTNSLWDASGHINRIEDATRQATKLAQGILAYSCKKIPSAQTISINTELMQNEYLYRMQCGDKIKLKFDLTNQPNYVVSSGIILRDIITTLISNSVEAIEHSAGTIIVKTDVSDKKAFLSVSDNGIGIDPSIMPNIFEPFFTTKNKRYGLGLSSAHGLIKAHGGDISAMSESGRTCFSVWLPREIVDNR